MNDEDFANTQTIEYLIYKKYQTAIHNDPPRSVSEFLDFLIESPIVEVLSDTYMCEFCHSSNKTFPLLYVYVVVFDFCFFFVAIKANGNM